MKNKKTLICIIILLLITGISAIIYFLNVEKQSNISEITNIVQSDISDWMESDDFETLYKYIVFSEDLFDEKTDEIIAHTKEVWDTKIDYQIIKSDIVFNQEESEISGIIQKGKSAIVPVKFKNVSFVDYYYNWSITYNEAILDSFIPLEIDSTLSSEDLLMQADNKIEQSFTNSFDNLLANNEIVITYLLAEDEHGNWVIVMKDVSVETDDIQSLINSYGLNTDFVYASIYLNDCYKIFDEEYQNEVISLLDEHLNQYAKEKYDFDLNAYISGLEKETEIIENELEIAKNN